jgi:hypothetical protein
MSAKLIEELRACEVRIARADLEQLGAMVLVSQARVLPQALIDPHDHAVVVQCAPRSGLDRSPLVQRPALEQESGHARKLRSFTGIVGRQCA